MKIIVQKLAVEYLDEGKGPVLLMLHGWQDSLRTFDAISAILEKKYRVIRFDLPGFGGSEVPKETWKIENYVQFVKDFCTKLGIEPEIILGHSFGGRIILRGVGEGALTAKKVVLIGSAGIAKTRTAKNVIITILAKIFGLLLYIPPMLFYRERLRQKAYRMIGSDYLDAGKLKETYLETIREDLQTYAAKISVPTLMVWGSDDQATPVTDGERLHSLIKISKLKVIDDASHFVHIEYPEKVAREIKEFIR